MLCKIADLIAEIPAAGGLAPRCEGYLYHGSVEADIVIKPENYRVGRYAPCVSENTVAYMESAYQFYKQLVNYGGFYLHASTAVLDGKAYLFSGCSGAGKSTHTRLWQKTFGPEVRIINDDKPALRFIDGVWYAYGTPWCGKDGININAKAPVAGLCFLKQADHNAITRLSSREALQRILTQTIYKFSDVQSLDRMMQLLDSFLQKIPVYELENLPVPEAARLSYETMRSGAEEAGL